MAYIPLFMRHFIYGLVAWINHG